MCNNKNISQYELEEGINYIKIHGLQRTGTNYITYLINHNFIKTTCLVNVGGWKHGHYCAPWTLGQEVNVLLVTKNPYSWLVSLYNYLKPSLSFENFTKRPLVFGEQSGSPYFLRASNPIDHWNNMNFHWMSVQMNEKKFCVIPFESFIKNSKSTLENISKYFNIDIKKDIIDTSFKVQPSNESPQITNDNFNSSFYTERKYMSFYTPEVLNFVNKHLDPFVLNQIGYRLEDN